MMPNSANESLRALSRADSIDIIGCHRHDYFRRFQRDAGAAVPARRTYRSSNIA